MELLVFVLPVCAAMLMNRFDSGWAAHSRNNDSCPPHTWSLNVITEELECTSCNYRNSFNNSIYE